MSKNYWGDKVVLITGASSGIGRALTEELLSLGAKISACSRSLDKLQELYGSQDTVLTTACDVSIKEDCKNFVERSLEKFGKIDVLINNAGISMRALFQEVELSVLENVMNINFWGTVNCTHYALDAIMDSKGSIVGVSSIAGYRGLPARTGYSASKFAMQGFLEALRTELLHSGVNVLWVCPGFTESNIRQSALTKNGQSQGETPLKENKLMSAQEVAKNILRDIEKGRRTEVMTSQGKLTVFMNKFFPGLTDRLVYNHFKKEEDSPLK